MPLYNIAKNNFRPGHGLSIPFVWHGLNLHYVQELPVFPYKKYFVKNSIQDYHAKTVSSRVRNTTKYERVLSIENFFWVEFQ